MASSKSETTTASRPMSAQRPVPTTGPVNVPARNGTPRNHSHSFSLGALNGSHRVARRKSISNNLSAVAAAMQGMDEASLEALMTPEGQAPIGDAANFHRAGSTSTVRAESSPQTSALQQALQASVAAAAAAAGDGGPGGVPADGKLSKLKPGAKGNKARRASEGAYLSKSEKKRANGEIRCETCGKGYKHSSCLTKHLWEHTPQWQVTSKLLISKHQQVQMLEAASVLVTMNHDQIASAIETIKMMDESDRSSLSPMLSGSSAAQDGVISSTETTPPPMIEEEEEHDDDDNDDDIDEDDDKDEEMAYPNEGQIFDSKEHHRYSSTSSVFSQSYQSATSIAGSIPTSTSYSSYHHFGHSGRRPSTSGTAYSVHPNEDDAKLAAAVEGVSFGTPKTTAVHVEGEIPPVPPLPARYALHKASLSGNGFASFGASFGLSAPTQRISDERGGRQRAESKSQRRSTSRGQSDDHIGMFSMEE